MTAEELAKDVIKNWKKHWDKESDMDEEGEFPETVLDLIDDHGVDYMDFSYYSGHGNNWRIKMRPSERVWFKDCPGYGDLPNGGDLEFLVFQSCAVIPAPPDVSDWWSKWWEEDGKHIFQGMHQAIGYRTGSYSGNSISTLFGQKVKIGLPVWQSWFNAVNEQRAMSGGGFYPGYAAAVLYPGLDGDTIYVYGPDPPMNAHWLRIYWQE